MINNKRVLIIIPAWNEAASIGDVIREVRGVLPEVDLLVVDDGSTDDTTKVARAAGATVTTLPYNLGVGGAMRLGYRYAYEHDYDVAIQVDADGQHDPRYVPKLVDRLDDASLVIGARFAGEGDYAVRGPRKWTMVMLSAVLSRMAKTKLTDTTSGFRACNRDIIRLFAEWYPVEYLGDTVETTVRVIRLKHKVVQVPVAMRARQAGTPSHSPAKAMVYLGRAFITLLLAIARR
ncbi:glycosyltransferase family 2 protein [Embleya sp. NPDC008237]|uniref:glycosyltransferase family 2 protein n=1 Tax=Embleya sp. NPDC008237 TaxID=3363978 RepID=UPI0036E8BB4B